MSSERLLTVDTESVPLVNDADRLALHEVVPGFWRAAARYGLWSVLIFPSCFSRPTTAAAKLTFLTSLIMWGMKASSPAPTAKDGRNGSRLISPSCSAIPPI